MTFYGNLGEIIVKQQVLVSHDFLHSIHVSLAKFTKEILKTFGLTRDFFIKKHKYFNIPSFPSLPRVRVHQPLEYFDSPRAW